MKLKISKQHIFLLFTLFISSTQAATSFVVDASKASGTTAGQKIANAIATLQTRLASQNAPLSGGVVDARGLTGQQVIDVPLELGIPFKNSISLLLGNATYYVRKTITLEMQGSIIGTPGAPGQAPLTVLKADSWAQLWAVVQIGNGVAPWVGTGAAIRDVYIDGNGNQGGTVGSQDVGAIVVNYSGPIQLTGVQVRNSAGQGILQRFLNLTGYPSTGTGTESSQTILRRVVSSNNRFSGFKFQNAADNFIYDSEFSNNGLDGIELTNTPTLRLQDSRLLENQRHGLLAYATPDHAGCSWCGLLIIVSNRFSGNSATAVYIEGKSGAGVTHQDNLIASNSFTGGACYPQQQAVEIVNSVGNLVSANTFDNRNITSGCIGQGPQLWDSAVKLTGSAGKNLVAGNTLLGSYQNSLNVTAGDVIDSSLLSKLTSPAVIADLEIKPINLVGLPTVDASQYAGATAGAKIANALASLHSLLLTRDTSHRHGVIDARSLNGNQLVDVSLQIGVTGQTQVTLLLGRGIYEVSRMITIGQNSAILGLPSAMGGPGPNTVPSTVLKAKDGAKLWAVVSIGNGTLWNGSLAQLHDLTIDGNRAGSGTVSSKDAAAVVVASSAGVSLVDLVVKNSASQGIIVRFTDAIGGSGGRGQTSLERVMSAGNALNGLNLENTWNTQITQSQFELNGANGVEVNTSPVVILKDSDLGSNSRSGLYAYSNQACTGCGWMQILGNQVGGNCHVGIEIESSTNGVVTTGNNMIAGNSFINGQTCQTNAMVAIYGGKGNAVVSNVIAPTGQPLDTGILLRGSLGQNRIAGNILRNVTNTPLYTDSTQDVLGVNLILPH